MLPLIIKHNPASQYYTEERCYINELSNSGADQAASVARATVKVGETTRWHHLEGITERYVMLSGSGRVEIGDLAPANVEPGDVVIIPPGCPQRINNNGQQDLVFLAICTPRFEQRFYQDIELSDAD